MKKISVFLLFALIFSLFSCSDGTLEQEIKEPALVHLSKLEVILYEEQTYRLVPTVLPLDASNAELNWTSSDATVCTVSDGLITARSPGIAIITAKTANGKAASAKIEVKKLDELKSIHFSELELSLAVGDTHALGVVSNPQSSSDQFPIRWSSSDSRIATVDKLGNVSAVEEGSCFIFADVNNNVRASCKVTVNKGDNDFEAEKPEADLSLLVSVTVDGLPKTFHRYDPDGEIVSTVEVTSYEVLRELTEDGVTVSVFFYGTKVYDRDGEDAENAVSVYMEMYKEGDEFCMGDRLVSGLLKNGEEVTWKYMFNAQITPTQREFYIVLSENGGSGQ